MNRGRGGKLFSVGRKNELKLKLLSPGSITKLIQHSMEVTGLFGHAIL